MGAVAIITLESATIFLALSQVKLSYSVSVVTPLAWLSSGRIIKTFDPSDSNDLLMLCWVILPNITTYRTAAIPTAIPTSVNTDRSGLDRRLKPHVDVF